MAVKTIPVDSVARERFQPSRYASAFGKVFPNIF